MAKMGLSQIRTLAIQNARLRQCFVVVLLLSSVLTLIPAASSQQFTTTTSLLTATVAVTSAFTQTGTSIRYSFLTSVSTGNGTLTGTYNPNRTMQGTTCTFPLVGFFNSTGTTHFQYSVGGLMTLYILSGEFTPADLAETLSEPDCSAPYLGYVDWPSYVQQISANSYPTSGTLNLTLPTASNPYTYVMVAPLSEGSPTATLTLSPIYGTYTTITTRTVVATSTTSSSSTVTFLSTLASVTTLQVPFTQAYGGLVIGIISLIAIIGVVAVAVTLNSRRRSNRGGTDIQVTSDDRTTAPPSEANAEKQFCTQCGLELRVGSRFCVRCGGKQEISRFGFE